MSLSGIGFGFLALASFSEWFSTFSLIFGGCCSNALTLELITSQYPPVGTLITFAQFVFVTLVGLRRQLVALPPRVSKDVAFKEVSNLLLDVCKPDARKGHSLRVAIHGDDKGVVDAFASELATSMKNNDWSYQLIHVDEHDTTHTSEDSRTSPGPTSRQLVDLPSSNPHVLLHTYYSSPGSIQEHKYSPDFIVTLRRPTLFSGYPINIDPTAHMVLDISDLDYPRILYPQKKQWTFNPLRFRFKARRIPLTRYLLHVSLFMAVSLLNNAAFAYRVPMTVHIIFRSGGLIVNMLMGRYIEKRKYSLLQMLSVLLVTFGIFLTTVSSMIAKPRKVSALANNSSPTPQYLSPPILTYATGILILTVALILSGFLGLVQDKTFSEHGRGNWEEAMFYIHALSLPVFGFFGSSLTAQFQSINTGSMTEVSLQSMTNAIHHTANRYVQENPSAPLSPLPILPIRSPSIMIPSFYVPLLANVATQLLCVSGVNRLTSRVNSLTVTLVLAVRKAVSLAISVLLVGNSSGNVYLWVGAAAVLLGTVGYTISSARLAVSVSKKDA